MVPTLHCLSALLNRSVRALDQDFGSLYNAYLDDAAWKVDYFVVQTGSWLQDRRVLISPVDLRMPFWLEEDIVNIDLSRNEIQDSPSIDAAKPVSRRQEELMNAYFGWPANCAPLPTDPNLPEEGRNAIETAGGELRSLREVIHYSATGEDDCEIGRVVDFIAEEPEWNVPYVVADTGGTRSSRRMLPTSLIEGIDWAQKKVSIRANQRQIIESPPLLRDAVLDAFFRSEVDHYYAFPKMKRMPRLRGRSRVLKKPGSSSFRTR